MSMYLSRLVLASQPMSRCSLPDGCGRIGRRCPSGTCVARTVSRLHERRWREKLGLFFVEGEDMVDAAIAEPVELLRAGEDVEPRLLASVATAPHPPRVIAVYRRDDLPAWEQRPATLALWRLADPGNVGTLIRTADAFGAAVVLSEGCADPLSPKALRASAGSIWRVPLGSWERVGGRRVALEAHGGAAARRPSSSAVASRSSSAPSGPACRRRWSAMPRRRFRSLVPSR